MAIALNGKEFKITLIEDYLQELHDEGKPTKDLAKMLELTPAMISQYRLKRGYKPSITVAKRVYKITGLALHPFSEESLKYELEMEKS